MNKKFLVQCSTNWCGTDATYPVLAEAELDVEVLAEQLAYENLHSYDVDKDIAEGEGYDVETMTDEDWDVMWENCDESQYYTYSIEEFTGDEEEWKSYGEPYEV